MQTALELRSWGEKQLAMAPGDSRFAAVSGDASARQYYRLSNKGMSWILVHSPPASEKNSEFLAVRALLEQAGIRVPPLLAADLQHGFLLLGDLGDRLLLSELSDATADASYAQACALLLRMAAIDPGDPAFPAYDTALLQEELGRFPQWFVQALLGQSWDAAAQAAWNPLVEVLVANALAQPRVLVHRDFHSRNLMPQPDGALAVIDFQDAVLGPITYDLVSLLRDCYLRWPAPRVRDWALAHRDRLRAAGYLGDVDAQLFLTWFDLMGLQRHIKVLGTFARLYLRDRKPAYLDDLPRVIGYVREISAAYATRVPAIDAFAQWFEAALAGPVAAQPWSGAP